MTVDHYLLGQLLSQETVFNSLTWKYLNDVDFVSEHKAIQNTASKISESIQKWKSTSRYIDLLPQTIMFGNNGGNDRVQNDIPIAINDVMIIQVRTSQFGHKWIRSRF